MGFEVGDIVLIEDVGPDDICRRFRARHKDTICVVVSRDLVTNGEGYWSGWLEPLFEYAIYPEFFFQVKLVKL